MTNATNSSSGDSTTNAEKANATSKTTFHAGSNIRLRRVSRIADMSAPIRMLWLLIRSNVLS